MRIENNLEVVVAGEYAVVTQMNGGSSFTLEISIGDSPFIPIDNGIFTSDATNVIKVPDCRIQGVSVGGAFSDVNLISQGS